VSTPRRFNIVDAAGVAAGAALVALVATGFALFRHPPPPRIDRVEPATIVEGSDRRVRVVGENLLPFFRVFLERAGGPATLSHRIEPLETSDEFTISNRVQARLVVESPTLAEIWIPDGTLPGTYTVALYDETRRVSTREQTFTLREAASGSQPVRASVRAVGAFTALRESAVASLTIGARFPDGAAAPAVEVLAVGAPSADTMRLQVGSKFVEGAVAARIQLPATLRVFCKPFDGRCRFGEIYVAALGELPIELAGGTARFLIHEITPDTPAASIAATVSVRFSTSPEVAARMNVGDEELPPVRLAPTAAIATMQAVTGAQPGLVVRDVALNVPVVKTAGQLLFRGEALKIGSPFTFTTADYKADGTVVAIRTPAGSH
jgi:hypothetical protein